MTFGAAGCANRPSVAEEANRSAEEGVAIAVQFAQDGTASLLASHTDLLELTQDELVSVFRIDLRNNTGATPPPIIGGTALYGLTDDGGGHVTFSVAAASSAYRASGLVTYNTSRHSCAYLSGQFGSAELEVTDADCPPLIAAAAGSDSEYVPMSRVLRDFPEESPSS